MHGSYGTLCALGLIGVIFSVSPAIAQITPDETLGNERSRVTRGVNVRGGNADRIDGGAARGANLFHSFSEFNVNEGQRVYFANPSGIDNILSRVTGRDVSDIMGTLGVDGGANLFLLNPNGIIFGPNARLDISGSFTASTANSFTFADGSEFSATNPGDGSLLSVSVPLGVQYGPNSTGALTNNGLLSVGQNLTLSSSRVTSTGQLNAPSGQLIVEGVVGDVQVRNATAQSATLSASNNLLLPESQLFTAGDLNLLAGNTVWIRDSVVNPFVAQAGGNLIVQGNQNIDIFALNHPASGLISGRDMVLRSANTVGGDAHYWTGGDFRIERLNGVPGDLFSPYDPVIRSVGDVSLGDYTGASLHIFAGGSVTAGDITITSPDRVNGLSNSAETTVSLSNPTGRPEFGGQQIVIDGRAKPTLDIRAGTIVPGTPPLTPNPIPGITPPSSLNLSNSATRADIRIGEIFVNSIIEDNPGTNNDRVIPGQVFLTNQYSPNQLPAFIEIFSIVAPGGSVTIDSRESIRILSGIEASIAIDSTSFPNLRGDGQSIRLLSRGNIETNSEFRGGISTGSTSGSGGTVFLHAIGNITTDAVASDSRFIGDRSRRDAFTAENGNISIVSRNGYIHTRGSVLSSADNGSTGSIELEAFDDVTTGTNLDTALSWGASVSSRADLENQPGNGTAGNITIVSRNGNINTTAGPIESFTSNGDSDPETIDSGSIRLSAVRGTITTSSIDSTARRANSMEVANVSAGEIRLEAGNTITTSGDINSFADGTGGAITFRSLNGEINTSRSALRSSTFSGEGGSVTLIANGTIVTDDIQSLVGKGGEGNGGPIVIRSNAGSINTTAGRIQSSTPRGNGGDIFISAPQGHVRANAIRSFVGSSNLRFSNNGSEVVLDASIGGDGNAGDITLEAGESINVNSVIAAFAGSDEDGSGRNRGGDISLIANGGNITTSGIRSLVGEYRFNNGSETSIGEIGNAGTIILSADGKIRANGRFASFAGGNLSNPGNAGNIFLTAGEDIDIISARSFVGEYDGDDENDTPRNGNAGDIILVSRTGDIRIEREPSDLLAFSRDSDLTNREDGDFSPGYSEVTLIANQGSIFLNDARLSTTNRGDINAGNIIIIAGDDIEITNGSRLESEGFFGFISMVALDNTIVIKDSSLSTDNNEIEGNLDEIERDLGNRDRQPDQAGLIRVQAGRLDIDNSTLSAAIDADGGDGGFVEIDVSGTLLRLDNNSEISAQAEGGANGGNVDINVENGFVLANPYEDNDIVASGVEGAGGNIDITTNAIFGLEERDSPTRLSDILASSEFGDDGEIVLNTLGVDPSRNPGELPIETVDAANLVAEGCLGRNRAGVDEQGEFSRTGRGGVSRSPTDPLSGETTTPPLASLDEEKAQANGSIPPDTTVELLVEAQRLRRNASGKVSLVAERSPAAPAPVAPPDFCPPVQ